MSYQSRQKGRKEGRERERERAGKKEKSSYFAGGCLFDGWTAKKQKQKQKAVINLLRLLFFFLFFFFFFFSFLLLLLLFHIIINLAGGGGSWTFGSPYLSKAQKPQKQRYPFLRACAVFPCVKTQVWWLPVFGGFNVRTNVDACDCIRGLYGHRKTVCTGS